MPKIKDDIDVILYNIIGYEGGFSDIAGDKGGKTMFGISSTNNPVVAQKIATRTLTIEEAIQIYRNKYVKWPMYEDAQNFKMRYLATDVSVWGLLSLRSVQRGLNEMFGESIAVDGRYGPRTSALFKRVVTSEDSLTLGSILYKNIDTDTDEFIKIARSLSGQRRGIRRRYMLRVVSIFEELFTSLPIGSEQSFTNLQKHADRQERYGIGGPALATYVAFASSKGGFDPSTAYKEVIV